MIKIKIKTQEGVLLKLRMYLDLKQPYQKGEAWHDRQGQHQEDNKSKNIKRKKENSSQCSLNDSSFSI